MNAFIDKLTKAQSKNDSLVCVGLDSDFEKIPRHLMSHQDPVFEFNKAVIDATKNKCCAYKPNLAFYEAMGPRGMETLKKTIMHIPADIPIIIDAKRGDIDNTAKKYAEAIFDDLEGDAVTLSPYMGYDSIAPFLEYEGAFVFVLCLTSNEGAKDFQYLHCEGKPLYMHVVDKVNSWNRNENFGLVVGASKPEQLMEIRLKAPKLPFLVPGVGAQGGDLHKAVEYGTAGDGLVIINISRGVIFASNKDDFAAAAADSLDRFNVRINQVRAGAVK
ncbi:MAG: orotidine-5'-phosphate decarboxylase [candidate division Zixibacteria bacterium]|nr:orotidine-5'-phosphate decarboxylase [candidate division Zixibacteria bacterium]